MGRRNRERIKRILGGEETPISVRVKGAIRSAGVSALQSYSTSKQIGLLADAFHSRRLSSDMLRRTLDDNARKEMRKGAKKFSKEGRVLTVELLLEEYWKSKEFQTLASEVGLDEEWFMALAKSECQQWRSKE